MFFIYHYYYHNFFCYIIRRIMTFCFMPNPSCMYLMNSEGIHINTSPTYWSPQSFRDRAERGTSQKPSLISHPMVFYIEIVYHLQPKDPVGWWKMIWKSQRTQPIFYFLILHLFLLYLQVLRRITNDEGITIASTSSRCESVAGKNDAYFTTVFPARLLENIPRWKRILHTSGDRPIAVCINPVGRTSVCFFKPGS